MSVRKSNCEKYTIYADGEFAVICVDAHETAPLSDPEAKKYGGQILVHSSFGSFAYSWSNCGAPFKEFLPKLEFHYFAQKMKGHQAYVFDGVGTLAQVKDQLIVLFNEGSLDGADVKVLADDLDMFSYELTSSVEEFMATMAHLESRHSDVKNANLVFADAASYLRNKADPAIVSFWTLLWPQFINALKAETAAAV